jgi:hypothetical protein
MLARAKLKKCEFALVGQKDGDTQPEMESSENDVQIYFFGGQERKFRHVFF